MATTLKPWIESVQLHPDVPKDAEGTDICALDLGLLADDSGTVAKVFLKNMRGGWRDQLQP